jgi:hypothetical protein
MKRFADGGPGSSKALVPRNRGASDGTEKWARNMLEAKAVPFVLILGGFQEMKAISLSEQWN